VGEEFDEVKLKVPAPSPATQGFRGHGDGGYYRVSRTLPPGAKNMLDKVADGPHPQPSLLEPLPLVAT
jgi:hypothetical protein